MKLTISKGNTKIGGIPNVSLLPGISCAEGVPCYADGCYAKKALMYPNVRKAWGENQLYAETDLDGYMHGIAVYLEATTRSKRFRWHVSGDILNQSYLDSMCAMAWAFMDISFLCFTKRYNLNYAHVPPNLSVVLSTWPGYRLPENHSLPWAWIEGDVRIPKDLYYFRCPGNCDECSHKCFGRLDKDIHVVFPKH